jgi:hypothetical protein
MYLTVYAQRDGAYQNNITIVIIFLDQIHSQISPENIFTVLCFEIYFLLTTVKNLIKPADGNWKLESRFYFVYPHSNKTSYEGYFETSV